MNDNVSVCIPVYNCKDFIGIAIESVLKQTYEKYELLIIDNQSTDGTWEEICEYQRKNPKIRVLRNSTNIGAMRNWNKVLEESRFDYIKILPADDVLYPDCLEKQVKILQDEKNDNVVMVNSFSDIIDNSGKKLFNRNTSGWNGITSGMSAIKSNISKGANIIGEPGLVLLRKQIARKVGGFDDEFGYVIDLDYWVRMLLHGDLYTIPETLSAFRISKNSWSTTIRKNQARDFKGFINKLHNDNRYEISYVDKMLGSMMVKVNEILRRIFYKVFL